MDGRCVAREIGEDGGIWSCLQCIRPWVELMGLISLPVAHISFVGPRRRLPPAPAAGREGRRARRCCQGWPSLAATVRLGLDGIEHASTLWCSRDPGLEAMALPGAGRRGRPGRTG